MDTRSIAYAERLREQPASKLQNPVAWGILKTLKSKRNHGISGKIRHCFRSLLITSASLFFIPVVGRCEPPECIEVEQFNRSFVLAARDDSVAPPAETPMLLSDAEKKAPGACLSVPMHFSEIPKLAPGVRVVLSRFLRFQDNSGRMVPARMFLLEVNQSRAKHDNISPEAAEKFRAMPARLFAVGHEIAVTEQEKFTPEFEVPQRSVKFIERCMYEIDLGNVKCMVRTVQ